MSLRDWADPETEHAESDRTIVGPHSNGWLARIPHSAEHAVDDSFAKMLMIQICSFPAGIEQSGQRLVTDRTTSS